MLRILAFVSTMTIAACWAQDAIPGSIAPYVPTPNLVVMRMLGLAELRSGEKMFGLGSGDGRLVLAAAEKFGADESSRGISYSRTTAQPMW